MNTLVIDRIDSQTNPAQIFGKDKSNYHVLASPKEVIFWKLKPGDTIEFDPAGDCFGMFKRKIPKKRWGFIAAIFG